MYQDKWSLSNLTNKEFKLRRLRRSNHSVITVIFETPWASTNGFNIQFYFIELSHIILYVVCFSWGASLVFFSIFLLGQILIRNWIFLIALSFPLSFLPAFIFPAPNKSFICLLSLIINIEIWVNNRHCLLFQICSFVESRYNMGIWDTHMRYFTRAGRAIDVLSTSDVISNLFRTSAPSAVSVPVITIDSDSEEETAPSRIRRDFLRPRRAGPIQVIDIDLSSDSEVDAPALPARAASETLVASSFSQARAVSSSPSSENHSLSPEISLPRHVHIPERSSQRSSSITPRSSDSVSYLHSERAVMIWYYPKTPQIRRIGSMILDCAKCAVFCGSSALSKFSTIKCTMYYPAISTRIGIFRLNVEKHTSFCKLYLFGWYYSWYLECGYVGSNRVW